MVKAIFEEVNRSASKMGGCDPRWLKDAKEPAFSVVDGGGKSGQTILLLHGLFGALSNWDTTLPLMAKVHKPVALQFPILSGHRSEVKVKALAAYTEYYIRKNNLGPVTLCGNSLGGHVALRLALASPDLVDCLILAGASGLYEHSVDSLPIRPDEKFVREHMSKVFFQQQFVTDAAVNEIAQILTSRVNTLNLIHAARSAKKDNMQDVLPQIKAPTLLLWGEDDTVTTMQVAETFNRLIPNSKLVTIKNCGHAPMIEYPEWFSAEVDKFINEHSRRIKK